MDTKNHSSHLGKERHSAESWGPFLKEHANTHTFGVMGRVSMAALLRPVSCPASALVHMLFFCISKNQSFLQSPKFLLQSIQ